jgi:hypothetical protein
MVPPQQHFDFAALLRRQLQCRGEPIELVVDRMRAMDLCSRFRRSAAGDDACCANTQFAAPTTSAITARVRMTLIRRYPRFECRRTDSTSVGIYW